MEKDFNHIIQKAIDGDEKAFRKLYDTYYKSLYFYALKLSNGNVADAQDAIQDTFLQIHASIKDLQSPEAFKVWSSRILYSKCTKIFQRNKYVAMSPEDMLKQHAEEDTIAYLPEEHIRFVSDQKLIHAFVERLPKKQKDVILLMYFGQFSLQEIAEILDVPLGTVKSRSKVARDTLKKAIEDYEQQSMSKLGFRLDALGTILITYYATQFAQMSTSIAIGSGGLMVGIKGWLTSMATPIVSVSLSVVVAVSGFKIYEAINQQESTDPIVQQNIKDNPKKTFIPVQYENIEIKDAKSAYYTLRAWAYDEDYMINKTPTEIMEINKVYNQLKTFQGTYWDMLVQDEWNLQFENL